MKQFLVSGRASSSFLPWTGEDRWKDVDYQYRLELCKSEISRWSIVLKQDDKLLGGVEAENHGPFSYIELINNCTTTSGFEFKLDYKGCLYHGSFGTKGGSIRTIYERLSRYQAGSLAKQSDVLDLNGKSFWDIYKSFADRQDKLEEAIRYSPVIDLDRYRLGVGKTVWSGPVDVQTGAIDYARWGRDTEYYAKPWVRRLLFSIEDADGVVTKEPPRSYQDIKDAYRIMLPNFTPAGVYDIADPKEKKHYRRLYGLRHATLDRTSLGFELSLLRVECDPDEYDLRRLVLGNVPLQSLPVFPRYWTLHRFGFGPRETTMDYNSEWEPATDPGGPTPFAYILGGSANDATHYVQAEGFGVERAVLSWEDRVWGTLVIDLIGFERILPVWQGRIQIGREISLATD